MKDHDTGRAGSDRLAADLADRDSVSDSWGRAAAYDAYADGLHTYALGGLRNHEAAASAVYCAFIAADHHVAHLGDADMLRPWLYAITRHYCRLGKLPRLGLSTASGEAWDPGVSGDKDPAMAGLERSLLAAELTSLDWPDTAGMQTAHREVLELSVRHGMESRAVGLMLARPAEESFELLAQAWTELERSLATVALLRTTREHCAQLAALASEWTGRLTARTREPLVSHVDTCSHCQYYLHTVIGTPQAPTILPHVAAPRALRARVLGDLVDPDPARVRAKAVIAGRLAAFDRWGFPDVSDIGLRGGGGTDGGGAGAGAGGASPRGGVGAGEPGARHGTAAAGPRIGASAEVTAPARDRAAARPDRHSADGRAAARPDQRARSAVAVGATASSVRVGETRPAGLAGGTRSGAGSRGMADSVGARGTAESFTSRGVIDSSAASAAADAAETTRPRPNRHRKSALRTLGGSAVLSGAGAAGITAFVLLAPSSPSHTTLFADPEGGATQAPGAPRPTGQGGAPIPVSGGPERGTVAEAGGPVAAQIVAAVVTTAPGGAPGGAAARTGSGPGTAVGDLSVAVDQRANDPSSVTVTLGNSGTGPVAWTASPDAPYLRLSSRSGVVQPGTQQSVTVSVDQASAPAAAWQAHVRFDPGGSTVVVHGTGSVPVTSTEPSKPASGSGPSTGSGPGTSPSSPPPTTPTTPTTPTPTTSGPSTTPPTTTPTQSPTTQPSASVGATSSPRPTSAHSGDTPVALPDPTAKRPAPAPGSAPGPGGPNPTSAPARQT